MKIKQIKTLLGTATKIFICDISGSIPMLNSCYPSLWLLDDKGNKLNNIVVEITATEFNNWGLTDSYMINLIIDKANEQLINNFKIELI
jgi:hypothetical protein